MSKDDNSPDIEALDNAIYKLKVYMNKTNQTLYGLASTMGFKYQPFYRLITKRHTPSISSFGLIASHLNCTISELIDNTFFLDINYYTNLPNNFDEDIQYKCRIYIPHDKYQDYIHETFFALSTNVFEYNKSYENNLFYLFFKTSHINIDGSFLVEYQTTIKIINVISVSSTYITIEEDGQEKKINLQLIRPIAKLFGYVEINSHKHTKLFGIA